MSPLLEDDKIDSVVEKGHNRAPSAKQIFHPASTKAGDKTKIKIFQEKKIEPLNRKETPFQTKLRLEQDHYRLNRQT